MMTNRPAATAGNELSTISSDEPSAPASHEPSAPSSEGAVVPFPEEAPLSAGAGSVTLPAEAAQHEEAVRQRPTPAAAEPLAALPGPPTALPEQLVALLAEAQALAQQGGLSKRATEAQKWQAADLIYALQRAVETQRDRLLDPFTPATPEAKASFQRSSLAYDAFLKAQERTRGTLVDAALTASTFPPGHAVRQGALSFSHARTLSRLRTERERTIWAARAAREGLSVARLWALILTEGQTGTTRTENAASRLEASGHEASPSARSGFSAGGLPAEEEVQNAAESQNNTESPNTAESQNNTDARNEASFLSEAELLSELELISESEAFVNVMRPRDRRRHHAHVCALTGQAIGDLAAMAEVRVRLDQAGAAALFPGRERQAPQGGAARRRVGGVPGSFPVLLRFADLAAVESWLVARRRLQASAEDPREDAE